MTSNSKEKTLPKINGYGKTEDLKSHRQYKPNIDPQIEDERVKGADENLNTLQKVHAILINCVNLTKKQKSEFAESERFFMKLHLKELIDKLKDP